MNGRKWLAMACVAVGTACGGQAPAEKDPAPSPEREVKKGGLQPTSPTMLGMSTPGFCADLKESLGQPDGMRAKLAETISCSISFGVDQFAVWGTVGMGYPSQQAETPTAEVNGEVVAQMNLLMTGAPARQLFEAMSDKWSGPDAATQRSSPHGRIRCAIADAKTTFCQLSGLVGFTNDASHYDLD